MIERLKVSLTYKLFFSFLAFALLAVAFQVVLSGTVTSSYIKEQSFEDYDAVTQFKKENIEQLFRNNINNLELLAQTDEVKLLTEGLNKLNDSLIIRSKDPFNVRNDEYIKIYNSHITYFSKLISTYGYEDFYLINIEYGQVMFSVKKKKDFGANIKYGRYKDSHLAELWKKTIKTGRTNIVDFSQYEPSDNEMAMFIATPVYTKNSDNDQEILSSIAIIQLSSRATDLIVQDRYACLRKTGESFIVGYSEQGKIELRSNREIVPGRIGDLKTGKEYEAALIKGESGSSFSDNAGNDALYISYTPLNIKDLNWALFTSISASEVYQPITSTWIRNLIGALIVLILIIIIGISLANNISRPVIGIKNIIMPLSKGVLPKQKVKVESGSEIGEIQEACNSLIDGQRSYIKFANSIGDNNTDSEFKKLSSKDMLGEALLKMKENLENAEKLAKQQQEEEIKQRWMTEGVAKFGDILRQNQNSINELGDNIITKIVEFLNIEQGGIFIYDDSHGEHILKLLSSFAFDRKKFITKEIPSNEGLIGACFMEKETIHLKNIPEDYPNISSGLGNAKPKEVLLIPLKSDVEVLGVIELVAFKKFEKHEVAFIEKIAENITSSIASSKISEQTKKLLEESKLKSEQMAAQEEEMRQNMEELQATQEESERREAENNSILEAINSTVMIAYFDLEGKISQMNETFLSMLGMTNSEVAGLEYKNFNMNVQSPLFWEDIREGEHKQITSIVKTKTKEVKLKEYYYPIKNTYNEAVKIINIAFVSDSNGDNQ